VYFEPFASFEHFCGKKAVSFFVTA